MISCENVTVAYDTALAVDHVSFSVQNGDYVCIVGENGSGKSTLLKSILGLVPLKCGKVTFGTQVQRKRLGYLPQQTNVQHDFPASVQEVVLSGCLNRSGFKPFYSKADKALAAEHLQRLGISDLQKRSFAALSGGQRQRVLLARALCATDKLLLLDEPVTGLDPLATNELYALIATLNRDLGVTVLMVSHDIPAAVQYADKILHLQQSLQFYGSAADYTKTELGQRFLHHTKMN
mgnify:CR=1 FL=1